MTKKNDDEAGKNRLRAKIISEAAYLIWIMRCEWQIGKNGDPHKKVTTNEATNRWRAQLGRMISTDIIATNKKSFKQKSINAELVESTWRGVVEEESLKESIKSHWNTGVLVSS
ncbi:hypothetical protein BKA70DRAFT_1115533 [Coprinopsis sp. MPI-PUGE-AT-0042]|nr:hypothetical protein BKA70DRAFT_1115533 [Coprinopsis sp. MPI-PUGE-AT-0042]